MVGIVNIILPIHKNIALKIAMTGPEKWLSTFKS